MLLARLRQLRPLQVRVQLDLVDRGRHLCRLHEGVDVRGQEVADADRGRQAVRLEFLHGCPGGLEALGVVAFVCEEGRVEKVQVDVVELELFERGA